MILNDRSFITQIRTAIAPIIVMNKYFSDIRGKKIGVCGSGSQDAMQLRIFKLFCPETEIKVYFRANGINKIEKLISTDSICNSITEICEWADAIITLTSSVEPIIKDSYIKSDKLIIGIGADDGRKNEIDPYLFYRADHLVVDSKKQSLLIGDTSHAIKKFPNIESKIIELGHVKVLDKLTIVDLTGISAQDVMMCEFLMSL